MPYPTDTLKVELAAADGVARIGSAYWRDITTHVRSVHVRTGRERSTDQVTAGTCTVVVDNRARQFDPTATANQWWSTDLTVPGAGYARPSSSTVGQITGDIDVRVRATLTDWTPAAEQTLASKWQPTGSRSWYFGVAPGGALRFRWHNGTSTLGSDSTAIPGFADGSAQWVRAVLDVSDGGNHTLRYYRGEGPDGPWTQVGTTVTGTGTTTVATSTVLMSVGSTSTGGSPMAGTVAEVIAVPLIDGPPAWPGSAWVRFDIGWGAGATTTTDYWGNSWSTGGGATITVRPDTSASDGSHLKPFRLLRVSARDSGLAWRQLFVGVTNPEQPLDLEYDPSGRDATVTFHATDPLALLANLELPEVEIPERADEAVEARLFWLLQQAGLGTISAAFDVGIAPLAGSTWGVNALSHARDVATSDGGQFWFEPAEQVWRYAGRHALLTDLRMSTLQATFGPSHTPYAQIDWGYGDTFVNRADLEVPWHETTVSRRDTDSIAAWGTSSYSATSEVRDIPQAEARAEYLVDVYGRPMVGPRTLRVVTIGAQAVADEILSLQLWDLVQVRFTPPGGTEQVVTCNIDRLEHVIAAQPSLTWTTTVGVFVRRAYRGITSAGAYLTLDHATQGKLDIQRLWY